MRSHSQGRNRMSQSAAGLRLQLAGLVFLGCAGFVCACERPPQNAEASTFTVLAGGDETITGPVWDSFLQHLVFSTLATINEQGDLEPSLAESWESSEDGRVWTVRLRRDVRWHDGVPFTARDVEFTLDLYAHPEFAWREVPGSYTVTVIDDWTYEIEFHQRTNLSLFPISAWRVFYPKHLLEDLDPEDFTSWDFWKEPVGTGPFRYVRHVPETVVEFQASPDYFDGEPDIERVVVKFGGVPITELMAGNVDASWVNALTAVKIRELPDFEVYHSVDAGNLIGILWNQKKPMFREAAVRKALTLAINRVELQKVMDLPQGIPIFDVPVSEEMFAKGEFPDALPYDPEQAKRILRELGWSDSDNDGIRDQGGLPFQFAFMVRPGNEPVAVYVQANLERIGIKMEIQTVAGGAEGNLIGSGEFDAALRGIRNRFYLEYFGVGSLGGNGDERLASAFESITQAVTPFEREEAFRALVPLFQEQMPATLLTPTVSFQAVHRRIRGLTNRDATSMGRFENLWIEEGEDEGAGASPTSSTSGGGG